MCTGVSANTAISNWQTLIVLSVCLSVYLLHLKVSSVLELKGYGTPSFETKNQFKILHVHIFFHM